jgi:hypothetical protein
MEGSSALWLRSEADPPCPPFTNPLIIPLFSFPVTMSLLIPSPKYYYSILFYCNFRENENFRETKFRENRLIFASFSLFAKMEKTVFVSTLNYTKRLVKMSYSYSGYNLLKIILNIIANLKNSNYPTTVCVQFIVYCRSQVELII